MKKIKIPLTSENNPAMLPGFQIIRYVDDFKSIVIMNDEYTPDEAILFFSHPIKCVTVWKVTQGTQSILYINR